MITDRNGLINAYNATSTGDGIGGIETYENWLERQLISCIKTIHSLEYPIGLSNCPSCCHTGSVPHPNCTTCNGTGTINSLVVPEISNNYKSEKPS